MHWVTHAACVLHAPDWQGGDVTKDVLCLEINACMRNTALLANRLNENELLNAKLVSVLPEIPLQQPKDICYRSGFCSSGLESVRMEKLMPAKSIPAKTFPAIKLEKPAVGKVGTLYIFPFLKIIIRNGQL